MAIRGLADCLAMSPKVPRHRHHMAYGATAYRGIIYRMSFLGRIPKHVTENPRALLHYVMKKCPLCGQAIPKGHRSWQLASAIVGTGSAARLEDLIEKRKWRESTAIAEFHVMEDDFAYHALSCDALNRIVILKVWLPFELFYRDRVIQAIELDPSEVKEVNDLARGKWDSL